jgi:hypothetical protein
MSTVFFGPTSKAWDPLLGAPLRFWLRFVATLGIRLGSGSGFSSAALFGFDFSLLVELI